MILRTCQNVGDNKISAHGHSGAWRLVFQNLKNLSPEIEEMFTEEDFGTFLNNFFDPKNILRISKII